MNTHFTLAELDLQLKRWPASIDFPNLQAWDAVDELLLTTFFAYIQAEKPARILVVNDQFGVMCCALLNRYPELEVWHRSDSKVSQLACRNNIHINQIIDSKVNFISSLERCPSQPDVVLMRVPRDHSYLQYQLHQLSEEMNLHTHFLVAAKAKDIHKNLVQLFSDTIGPTTPSLTTKKCRMLQSKFHSVWPKPPRLWPKQWHVPEHNLTLINHANVFSGDKLDIGARFFLSQLPDTEPDQTLVDLGCGNGVIGLAALLANPKLRVIFSDESFMAVESARLTVTKNAAHLLDQCTFVVDDGLSQQASNSVDWVLCNPPFHQQQTITTHLARQMFADAKRVLKPAGRLRIVANRHLPYGQQLQHIFASCRCLASHQKFVILESQLRSQACE